MRQLTVLFLIKDGEVLLAMKKRGFGKGKWNGVGGKVEPGETIKQAMARECHEEIMASPQIYEQVADIIFDELHNGTRENMQVHVFICKKWMGEPQETEEMAPRWFKFADIPYETMWADDPYWLPLVLNGKKIKATFRLDDQDNIVKKQVKEVVSL